MSSADEQKERGSGDRAARLEAELRANLKKRKQQAKARARASADATGAAGKPTPDEPSSDDAE